MINYIIQVLLFQALFLAVYDFFLQKETFFKWNRIYLLATPLLSFLIPLLKFESVQKAVPQEYVVYLPEVVLNPQVVIEQTVQNESSFNYMPFIIIAGMVLFLILFLTRIYKIITIINSNRIIKKSNYKLVLLAQKQAAFSFFNYIFINNSLIENKELNVIQHELVHCRQKHSIDLLVFEFLKIAMWFNPLIYVYQKRITLLHEYIADSEVVKSTNKNSYFNQLLAETFNVENISFINHFFKQSLIKNRIAMITKNKSGKIKQLKYLLLIPLLFGMLIYSSCTDDTQTDIDEINKVIGNEVVSSKGNYFEGKNGIKIFTGDHLEGEVVPFKDMTKKEQEIFNNFKKGENSKIEYSLVIDNKGDRVHFLKIPMPPRSNNIETLKKTIAEDDGSVPFAVIEDVPIYPGCEGTKEELRLCLQEKITQHVSQNFNSDLANSLGLKAGTKRIFVLFKIDKEGNITNVDARAPHQSLADEAIRVINSLPKMIPGKMKGKNVGVKYSLPIAFKIAGNNTENDSNATSKNEFDITDGIPFSNVENVPIYPGCKGTEEELRVCLQDKITSHVDKNFNTGLFKELKLNQGTNRFFVMFKIDKNGNINDIQARASHKALEEEAIRVINSLPQMTPGKQDGEVVGVKYSLPIAFNVE